MSGICGIVPLDGSAPDRALLERLVAALERRGPDATRLSIERDAALGHTLLATTPEALVERLPWRDDSSGCTITADARIDNRDDLIAALGLTGETRVIGDGELILRAYLAWGEACPARLLGDFAFAIWDARSATLFCARDAFGMRQLAYRHAPGDQFLFATEPNAIAGLVDAPINPARIGDFLSNMEGADFTSTFFEGIFRLAPGHSLTLTRAGMALTHYWSLDPEPTLVLPSDEAYAAAFRAIFTEAVRCRLRSTGALGVMLSGGIDSNAVAAIAARLESEAGRGPLATFSAIDDATGCVETGAILTAIGLSGLAPTTVNCAAPGLFDHDFASAMSRSDEPFDGPMALHRAVYLAARRAGAKVVIDGASADAILSSPFHSAWLLRQGRLTSAWRDALGLRRFFGKQSPISRELIGAAWQAFAPFPLRALRFWSGRRRADRQFVARLPELAPALDPIAALKRRKHVQRRDLDHLRIDPLARLRDLTHPNVVVGRERYDRVAGSLGIEPRDPFLDLRLVRFCLSLPRDQLQRDGWPKWILRSAMVPSLPAAIVWRRGKQHLGMAFTRALLPGLRSLATAAMGEACGKAGPSDDREINNPLSGDKETIYLSHWFAYMQSIKREAASSRNEGNG